MLSQVFSIYSYHTITLSCSTSPLHCKSISVLVYKCHSWFSLCLSLLISNPVISLLITLLPASPLTQTIIFPPLLDQIILFQHQFSMHILITIPSICVTLKFFRQFYLHISPPAIEKDILIHMVDWEEIYIIAEAMLTHIFVLSKIISRSRT